ncbi:Kyphoscoliosis peptidase [Vanrija pseudolonga]|uniref:Kyphoscoliosis peptidase n=1 Tax=Vanrija pseudolonga TaxID=143232 RepID=A0AAF0YBT7_9TREE|nr:Kyphoscoliosis peptidase [Vanrija pseudolonga]
MSPPLPPASPDCLQCRDFSAADAVGGMYPRDTLPRSDPIGFLAHHLCSPFPSATDKARAIFTWFHHNMDYDVASFVGHLGGVAIAPSTPAESILSGVGVCAGYAGSYAAIATAAGLECTVVNGHGKGVGYHDWQAGEPVPAYDMNHAWNAVRVDGGEWKLVDACWGAGYVDMAAQVYHRKFKPEMFTRPNDQFGWAHFPEKPAHAYREDGASLTWDEYIAGPGRGVPLAQCFGEKEGIDPFSLTPGRYIAAGSDAVVRLQFSKVCAHWNSEVHGPDGGRAPPLVIMPLCDPAEFVPFHHSPDGCWWWLDVEARRLGKPGDRALVAVLKTLGDKSGRGVSADEFLRLHRRVGVSFDTVAVWELV